jgi:hypothetical protein
MPMHPSTQVTHIPDIGVIDPSVLFFVRVAAEEFILESVIAIAFSLFPLYLLLTYFRISHATQGSM